jgi:NNP family nitrate/nitrite transporter-like MFS transporter
MVMNPATWQPEDEQFWEREGKRIANRNLWISVPCLLCAFSVWMYWSIIIVQMENLGFPFSKEQLYTLTAIAGLAGATFRIPNAFLIALAGGRNVVTMTTALLVVPALGAGFALRDPQTPFAVFAVLAALSGLGGGNFASSMSNISFFFPKRAQGTALGLNAGLGNLGVSVMQVLLPAVMTAGVFGAAGGAPILAPATSQPIWIQNCGLVWVPVLVLLTGVAWQGMDNLPLHQVGPWPVAMARALWLVLLGAAGSAVGLGLLLGLRWSMWLVLPLTVAATLVLLKWATPRSLRDGLSRQFAIFANKHCWIMTWLYVMTFGSFIGYSAAFPKLIQDVFGTLPNGLPNPHAPNPFVYAWLGPLVGSLARPLGGWISDRWGGARVTQWDTVVMIGAALGVAWCVVAAGQAARPELYLTPFLLLFLLLFITTGVGNGSTFRMVPIIFRPDQAGPVLGWTSAVAAYGAFIIPQVFGAQIKRGTPEVALYGFAAYYLSCLAVNWWFYARRDAELAC